MQGYSKIEIFHSRPVVPTRRISLGEQIIDPQVLVEDYSAEGNVASRPVTPQLTMTGLLLACVVGKYASNIHPDLWEDLEMLIDNIERNQKILQPFMRFRLQTDKVGLAKTTHTLTKFSDGGVEDNKFKLSNFSGSAGNNTERPVTKGTSLQQVLGALYATRKYVVSEMKNGNRGAVDGCISAIRTALSWWGTSNQALIDYLLYSTSHLIEEGEATIISSTSWALDILGIDLPTDDELTGSEIQRHFRKKLWSIHPDRGGDPAQASRLIPELAEARRVLLATK